ncbi:DNA repair protein RecN [Pseudochryseolinea flava]|uniref:DNA repair protein RecN n=1 Tax=Pseudochryseolinea flava TaxID=2059302 RepID=A0A364Y2W2_9BACT|nr:DNA repair protein RecN [Pseudochryseolinea flava]RAW01029.1 DNA repair protein RecN [Pseudochryseolinea flava]
MLKHLTIKNYALIKHLELDPSAALNVVTGETGAGKSIMLGAIGLLMGNRADTKVLWDEQEKCVTEGVFFIKNYKLKSFFKTEDLDYDENTVIRREISPGGKSRAFINDTPVTLEVMKKLGGLLMDIHSQHETLQLANQTFQLRLIDAYAENQTLVEAYDVEWASFLKAKREYETLASEAEHLRQESDFIRFQLDELKKADLTNGEQESLESELKVMEHAEEIKSRFQAILETLTRSEFAVQTGIKDSRQNLSAIASYAPQYEALLQRLDALSIELSDIISEIENEENKIEFDPQRSEIVNDRLSTLYRLLKKHKAADVNALLLLQQSLDEKNSITSNLDEALAAKKNAFDAADQKVREAGKKLSSSRQKALQPLCKQLIKLLQTLGIPEANLLIDHQTTEPTNTGIDKIDILFSANKGIAPRALASVASGGEFSRVMFCIKYVMAEKTAMPTLILDEIDTGISGEVSIKLGNMMKDMSKKHQLITITHLPQIAAKGDMHYFVYKDNSASKTISNIRTLNTTDRVEEIAKMIGGEKPSKIAIQNAEELLRA